MNSVDKVNRELARLDTELRAGGIDRASFRAQRRKLLLDFEERETTTQPSAISRSEIDPPTVEPTVQDPPFLLPEPAPLPPPAAVPASGRTAKPLATIVLAALGAIVILALGGWWLARPTSETPAALPATPSAAGIPSPALNAAADTPQSLAVILAESQWSDADVADFLARWKRLSPNAIRAASEDSRIWLLRFQAGQRLREARELESLQPSSESKARVEQLEMVQSAIGSP